MKNLKMLNLFQLFFKCFVLGKLEITLLMRLPLKRWTIGNAARSITSYHASSSNLSPYILYDGVKLCKNKQVSKNKF